MVGRRARRGQLLVTSPLPSEKTGWASHPVTPPVTAVVPVCGFPARGQPHALTACRARSCAVDAVRPRVLSISVAVACVGPRQWQRTRLRKLGGLDGGVPGIPKIQSGQRPAQPVLGAP